MRKSSVCNTSTNIETLCVLNILKLIHSILTSGPSVLTNFLHTAFIRVLHSTANLAISNAWFFCGSGSPVTETYESPMVCKCVGEKIGQHTRHKAMGNSRRPYLDLEHVHALCKSVKSTVQVLQQHENLMWFTLRRPCGKSRNVGKLMQLRAQEETA